MALGVPVEIPKDSSDRLTVKDVKAELPIRKGKCSSKARKQELLDQLTASLDLPVAVEKATSNAAQRPRNATKGTLKHWKMDQPVRRLLHFEIKEGNTPLDANEMGPAEVHCKCHESADEFSDVEHNDMFILRLKSLRQCIMKEEPLLKWSEQHPARKLLFDEISEGRIPLDAEQMGAAKVWCNYHNASQFKMRGMKFGDTFKRRLVALRNQIRRDKNRAADDKRAVAMAIRNHPPPTHNHRGEPQWNGSVAQRLLKEDIAAGKHLEMLPAKLQMQADRMPYRDYEPDTF